MKVLIALTAALLVILVAAQQRGQGGRAESECETWRKRELARAQPIPGGITPECETTGEFKGLQCHDQRWCQCWRPDGTPITQASTKIKKCECIRQKDTGTRGPPGSFKPECRENGTYAAQQCNPSTNQCWCSDLEGNKLGQPVSNRNTLTC